MNKFKYFELAEFLKSDTATKRRIDNTPTFEVVDHLSALVMVILDPLREAWGGRLNVTSGYRSARLNTAVGGAITSAHCRGYAADIQTADRNQDDFMRFAEYWLKKNNVPFDQSIKEKDSKGNVWWHISLYSSTGAQRRQYLAINKD